MEIEFKIYEHYKLPTWCYKILSGVNRIVGETGRASIKAKRMSGEMNTSLGNSLMNFFFVFHVMRCRGLEYGKDWDAVFEGDDGLIGSIQLPTSEEFAAIGCSIDITPVQDIGASGYCGLYFGENMTPVVDPQHAMQALWSLSCPDNAGDGVKQELLNGKLLGLLHRAPGCPLVYALIRKYMKGTYRIPRSYWGEQLLRRYGMDCGGDQGYWMRGDIAAVVPEPTVASRVDYEVLFGVPVAMQLECEAEIMKGEWKLFCEIVSNFNPRSAVAAEYIDCL
jgi:hypothetical protein